MAGYFYAIASLMLTGYLLLIAKMIVNPLLAGLILALALKPLVSRLEYYKISRLLSTLMVVLLLMVFLLLLILFFSVQVSAMDFGVDNLNSKFSGLSGKAQKLLTNILGISPKEQMALMQNSLLTFLKNSASMLNNTLSFTTQFLSGFVFFLIALFFFLYYRQFLVAFLYRYFGKDQHAKVDHVLHKMQSVVSHYVVGLSLVIAIVAILNTTGLLLMGIDNAVTFGVLAAILTLIPYIGIIIGSLLPVFFVILTKNSLWYAAGVIIVFALVQFLEGNILTPNIVGRQVSINPFAAILGLITAGMLLGIVGAILALPILAILKVICDESSTLKPIGYLFGSPEKTD